MLQDSWDVTSTYSYFTGVFRSETYTGEKQCSQGGIDKAHDPLTKEDAEEAEEQQNN